MFMYIENLKYKIKSNETLNVLKTKVHHKTGISPRLTCNGKELRNNQTLSYYKINKLSMLTLIQNNQTRALSYYKINKLSMLTLIRNNQTLSYYKINKLSMLTLIRSFKIFDSEWVKYN